MATTVSHPLPSAQAQAIADLTGYEDAATLRWQQACVQAANTLTALPNGRYVNVRMERMRQGLELAQRGAVTLPEDGEDLSAVVRSGSNLYQVDTRLLTCTCADYQKHLQACKHLLGWKSTWERWGSCRPPHQSPLQRRARACVQEVATTAAPTTASWPISEAPASLNIKLKIGNMELMFTMRDVDDLKLQRRATMSLPWLQDILHGCEANLAAAGAERSRQQAEEERQAQARSLDEQIAAAVAAAMKAQTSRNNGQSPQQRTAAAPPQPPDAERLASAHDHEPSWCPKHQVTMRWHEGNARGPGWFSHQLADGSYCKGK